jgi:hypothetical protein
MFKVDPEQEERHWRQAGSQKESLWAKMGRTSLRNPSDPNVRGRDLSARDGEILLSNYVITNI